MIGVGSVFSPHLLIRAVMSSMSDLTERAVSYWARENVEESLSLLEHRGNLNLLLGLKESESWHVVLELYKGNMLANNNFF